MIAYLKLPSVIYTSWMSQTWILRIHQAFSQTGSRSEQIEHVYVIILNRVYLKVLQRHCIDNTFVNACLFLSSNWNITMIYN